MSMAIFSRNTDEAVHLRDLFIKMLPTYGIVTDCVAYSDQNALSADTLQKDFRYGLICCESETDLLLALAMMKLRPDCKVVLVVANDELAVQSYLLGPKYCCRRPVNEIAMQAILCRFSA